MQPAAALLEHRTPEKHCAGQRNQAEQRAQEIIPAIHERVLEPDVKDGSVLRDRARAHARAAIVIEISNVENEVEEPSPALSRPNLLRDRI